MSPRGVAITGVRERLFEAAERLLAREGTAGLTSRAVTSEAGCAKGILHSHFDDLDDFVAQLVVHRLQQVAETVGDLPARAGRGSVGENLTEAAVVLLDAPGGPALAALALTRPGAAARIRDAWQHSASGFDTFEGSLTAYLQAEQRLGRVPADQDCAALALAVTGTTHHLLMTTWHDSADPHERIRQVVRALLP
ncbi:TetR/AcrR family transcriptional regulator [Peterkaempfera sp. SMS 1(5)a]|uniref:TetR/AcrR family transcriptional regulator n=1 Tax=Peterkaempfera podocarpi TaxID=3232308 RepID=UPI00366D675C